MSPLMKFKIKNPAASGRGIDAFGKSLAKHSKYKMSAPRGGVLNSSYAIMIQLVFKTYSFFDLFTPHTLTSLYSSPNDPRQTCINTA